MARIAAIGVDDDFSTRETGITLRTTDHEFACGVDQITAVGAIGLQREICCRWQHNVRPEVFDDAIAHLLLVG